MTLRALFVAILMLACGPASAAWPGVRAAPREAPAPPIVFYIAKGGPDACGSGCDSWIAVEGQIDSAAASRFRKFLRQIKGRDLPIYFSSPGGNLDQALAMGAMLRERPIIRFGIDRRTFVETPWTLETATRPYIRKIALAKKDDGASSRMMEWRLFCENRSRARLMFIHELDKGAPAFNSVIVMAGSEKPVTFGTFPARAGTYEAWSGTITSDAMKAVLAVSHLQVGEGRLKPDGKVDQDIFDIDTSGLGPAWTRLFASCPAAPNNERSAIASPGPAAAPAR